MDVKFNSQTDPIGENLPVQKRARKQAPTSDSVRLDQSASLDRALAATPPVRSEAVERARKLIADPAYPSQETLGKVAKLLAASIKEVPE